MAGHVASELWEGERRFDVTVRLPHVDARGRRRDPRHACIPLKDGSLIPLSAVADVSMGTGRAAITRENGRRYVGVRMNVRNRDLGSFVAEAQQQGRRRGHAPAGLRDAAGAASSRTSSARWRGSRLVIPLALVITFLLLFSAFGSSSTRTRDHAATFPSRSSAASSACAIAGMTLSVSAAVGFIALLGQAVLNGVLVVAAIRDRDALGQSLFDAVTAAPGTGCARVLMTGAARLARPPAGGAVARHRQRDPAPDRGGRCRRHDLGRGAHARRAARHVLLGPASRRLAAARLGAGGAAGLSRPILS